MSMKNRLDKLEKRYKMKGVRLLMPKWQSEQLPPDVREFHDSGKMAYYATDIEIYNSQWKHKNFFEFTQGLYDQYLKDQRENEQAK